VDLSAIAQLDIPSENYALDEIQSRLPQADGLVTGFGVKITRELMESAPKLKIIANYGVGYNNIDVAAATERGIQVTNTPDSVTEPTAELALGLMLAITRRISELDARLKAKEDMEWGVMTNLGTTLQNKTLGVLGMGQIGRSFARKAQTLGMRIIYHNRNRLSPEYEQECAAEYVSFSDLLQQSDVLSLHTPLTEGTFHMIDEQAINMMKESAYIVNTARGSVIDEKALARALKENRIQGAALDVFEAEPRITEDLLEMHQVVLTPHIGTASYEGRVEMMREVAHNLVAYIEGKTPPNIVNPDVLSF